MLSALGVLEGRDAELENVLLETLSPDCVLASICPWAKKVMPEVDVGIGPAEFVAEGGAVDFEP